MSYEHLPRLLTPEGQALLKRMRAGERDVTVGSERGLIRMRRYEGTLDVAFLSTDDQTDDAITFRYGLSRDKAVPDNETS